MDRLTGVLRDRGAGLQLPVSDHFDVHTASRKVPIHRA
jgi:hypothetical protein